MTLDRRLTLVTDWAIESEKARQRRDRQIREAHTAGHTLRAIAAAADMSVEGVRKIINRG